MLLMKCLERWMDFKAPVQRKKIKCRSKCWEILLSARNETANFCKMTLFLALTTGCSLCWTFWITWPMIFISTTEAEKFCRRPWRFFGIVSVTCLFGRLLPFYLLFLCMRGTAHWYGRSLHWLWHRISCNSTGLLSNTF